MVTSRPGGAWTFQRTTERSRRATESSIAATLTMLCDSMEGVGPPLPLEAMLDRTTGTVTALLEELAGEPVDAGERRHTVTEARDPNFLGVAAGHPLLRRSVVLSGRRSKQPYVYAESLLVPRRLPPEFYRRLETSEDPIGRVLTSEGIAFSRVPLPSPDPGHVVVQGNDVLVPDDCLLARTYRIDVAGTPVMEIAEWFLSALQSISRSQERVSEPQNTRCPIGENDGGTSWWPE
jgi:chorismate-pyruvate lyase